MTNWTVQSGTLNTTVEAETPKEAVYLALPRATGNLGLIVEVRPSDSAECSDDSLYFHTVSVLTDLGLMAKE